MVDISDLKSDGASREGSSPSAPTCSNCNKPDWQGESVVTPPSGRIFENMFWHRRTTCKFCEYKTEEIRAGGLIPLISRNQPINLIGKNPFEDD